MFGRHLSTILTALLCAAAVYAVAAVWLLVSGRRDLPVTGIVGLAFGTAVGFHVLQKAFNRRRARRLRTVPAHRHRKADVR